MNELIKIRDVSAKYEISARTLRYYEDMGLIASTRTDDYAYRLYDEAAVKRLEQILILRKLNISIKDIRRIFDTPGSDTVLDVLSKKVDAIDEEVALLHELKEIVLDFIRQIEQADFGKESDVKLLYKRAREIETQLVNVEYEGNAATVNRLLAVTEKLSMTPEITPKHTYCYLIFNLKDRRDVIEACKLYCDAFGAEKTSEDTSASEWIDGWIGINIKLFNFEIFMQSIDLPSGRGGCCVNFGNEQDLRKAYDLLSGEAESAVLDTGAHWTPLCANIRDKFGVSWFFCL